jgi:hypothetical protein
MKNIVKLIFLGVVLTFPLSTSLATGIAEETIILSAPPTPSESPQAMPLGELLENKVGALSVDISDRETSRIFYHWNYEWPVQPEPGINWTGNVAGCNAGDTAAAFKDAVLLRINYFRAMAGVPGDITFSSVYSQKAQKAALMMSANNKLDHDPYPPEDWVCYTDDGRLGANKSNLHMGSYGWNAISSYMKDSGEHNTDVGHRRWILYPNTQVMGTGDIPGGSGYPSTNALWVIDSYHPRPSTREEYVAWPPPGFVPYQVVYPRWSFSYAGADFTSASVSVTKDGANEPVTIIARNGDYGESSLVWSFDGIPSSWPQPGLDVSYDVAMTNVMISGSPRTFSYRVTVFNPAYPLDTSLPPLLAFFPFEGNANDCSGKGHHGSVHGATLVSGLEASNAYHFDGINDYIQIPLNINPSKHSKLTMGAWVKPDSNTPVQQVISSDNGGYDRSLCMDYRGGDDAWSAFCGSGGVLGCCPPTCDPVDTSIWSFLAVVYDQGALSVRLHAKDDSVSRYGVSLGEGTNEVYVGKNPTFGDYLQGAVDNVFFFSEALSAGQITYIRLAGSSALYSAARKMVPAIPMLLLLD